MDEDICRQGLTIKKGESRNISFDINISSDYLSTDSTGINVFNWFLYSGSEYYFKVVIVVKIPLPNISQRSYQNSVKCLILNLASLVLLVSIIISMKK